MKTYIGDGIYAEWDGYTLVLTTENGYEATNTIVFEPREWQNLVNWFTKISVAPQPQQTDGDAVHHQQEPRSPDTKLDLE